MAIRFKCPHCGTPSSVASEFAGQVSSCARCGRFTIVPDRVGTPTPVQPATARGELEFVRDTPRRRPWHPFWQFLGFCGIVLAILSPFLLPRAGRFLASWNRNHDDAAETFDPFSRGGPCDSNLRQLEVALSAYIAANGTLPPAYTTDDQGRPMHSWRVLILPFLGKQDRDLYDQFRMNEPWDSPHNIGLLDRMPRVYACHYNEVASGLSNYVVITGQSPEPPETMFAPGGGVRPQDIGHELEGTILVAEVAQGVPWTMPADLELRTMTMRVNDGPASISSHHGHWAHVLFADGTIDRVYENMDPETLRRMVLANHEAVGP